MYEKTLFYILINGMDLTGKTTLANNIAEESKMDLQILRSSFSKTNPLNRLASRLRKERASKNFSVETLNELYAYANSEDPVLAKLLKEQKPIISDEAIGHLYANATAKELELFNPSKNIIQDSSTIIKSLTIHEDLGTNRRLIEKFECLLLKHPKPTKPNFSFLLEASTEAKIFRLNKRIKEGEYYAADTDEILFKDPQRAERQAKIMKKITLYNFPGTIVFDTTKMSEKEVYNAVKDHLDFYKEKQ